MWSLTRWVLGGIDSLCLESLTAPPTPPHNSCLYHLYPPNDLTPDSRGVLGQVGKMELFSESFKHHVTACLDHPRVLVLGEGRPQTHRGRTQYKPGPG